MTEEIWLCCQEPKKMAWVLCQREGSERGLRLFACAAIRRIWHLLWAEPLRQAVEVNERHADGTADVEELRAAHEQAEQVAEECEDWAAGDMKEAAWSVVSLTTSRNTDAEWTYWDYAAWIIDGLEEARHHEALIARPGMMRREDAFVDHIPLCHLLRDIFGNLFRPRPPISPSWLEWREAALPKLAMAIYEERRFECLPILADALEEAGCTNPDILSHCRGIDLHTRGCWVLDAVLGRHEPGSPAQWQQAPPVDSMTP